MWSQKMENDVSSPLACRGCLATDVKLFNMHTNNLVDVYNQTVGYLLQRTDGHPQHLCSMCIALFNKFSAFRTRCRSAHELLLDAEVHGNELTTSYIRGIDRNWYKFKPHLVCSTLENIEILEIDEKIDLKEESIDDCKDDEMQTVQPLENMLLITNSKVEKEIEKEEKEERESIEDAEEPEQIYIEECSDHSIEVETDKIKVKTKTKKKRLLNNKQDKKKGKTKTKTYDEIVENANSLDFEVAFLTKAEQLEEIENKLKDKSCSIKCGFCGKNFRHQDNLDTHIRYHHDQAAGNLLCEICKRRFKVRYKLRAHLKLHREKYCCKKCDYVTSTRYHMKKHYEYHEGKLNVCQYCDRQFGKLTSYFSHVRLKHGSELIWCEFCGESFIGEKGLHCHKRLVHKDFDESKFVCVTCKASFTNDTALKRHESSRRCDLPNCKQCGDIFASELLLKYHLIQHHRNDAVPQAVECDNCKVRFHNAAALKRHLFNATASVCGDGLSPCVQCGENFDTEEQLNEHVVENHNDENFKCEECGKTFNSAYYFRDHYSRIHLDRLKRNGFRNENTSKRRSYGRKIDKSVRKWRVVGDEATDVVMEREGRGEPETIGKEKVYPRAAMCEVCGKSFQNPGLLKYHQRTHSGERPFQCTDCPKSFMTNRMLIQHIRVHTGERPYRCEHCPKAFKCPAGLNRHNLIHTGVRRHVCQLCNKTFQTSSCVKLHIRTVHMKLPTPPRNRRRRLKDE